MAFTAILYVMLSLCVADVASKIMCVCNKDDGNQVEVYDSPLSNSTIGYLYPHQCKPFGNTAVSYQGWIALQFDNREGFVVNNGDFILMAECPSIGSQTTTVPIAISSVHPTSGCTTIHVTASLTGDLSLCPRYVRQVMAAKCHLLTQNGNSCYEFTRGHFTWAQAIQHCTERGGHLVTINSAHENKYLHQILSHTNHTNRVWIGLQDRNKEGHFQWVTGEAVSYTHWSANATHDGHRHGANNRQDCTVITPDGHWEDVKCSTDLHHRYSYICEYNARMSGSHIIG